MTFSEKLKNAIELFNSQICVGIDPERKKIPAFLWELYPEKYAKNLKWRDFSVLYRFCVDIVDATAPYCCAFKPNLAFFEGYGVVGFEVLAKLVAYIKANYPDHVIILDGKRNDIGNSATQYALGLKNMGADVVTVNPYMGLDTIQPFADAGLGILVLCLTSNDGASDFQKRRLCPEVSSDQSELCLYEEVALKTKNQFGNTGNFGLVVGATHHEELSKLRQLLNDDTIFLIPGLKTQGGQPIDVVKANGRKPALINVSRSVLYKSDGENFAEAAGQEAKSTKDETNHYRALVA